MSNKTDKSYFEETSRHFCHKLLAEHRAVLDTFLPLADFCDLPVFDQITLPFYIKNAESPGFENFRLTGLCILSVRRNFVYRYHTSVRYTKLTARSGFVSAASAGQGHKSGWETNLSMFTIQQ